MASLHSGRPLYVGSVHSSDLLLQHLGLVTSDSPRLCIHEDADRRPTFLEARTFERGCHWIRLVSISPRQAWQATDMLRDLTAAAFVQEADQESCNL